MSTIVNSSEDTTHQNTFSMVNEIQQQDVKNQQIDLNLAKKFLTGHRGKLI
jgi:hypothetical protein